MSVITERIKQSIGKEVIIFLNNGFKYSGKVTNFDENKVEILRTYLEPSRYKIIDISDIKDMDVLGAE